MNHKKAMPAKGTRFKATASVPRRAGSDNHAPVSPTFDGAETIISTRARPSKPEKTIPAAAAARGVRSCALVIACRGAIASLLVFRVIGRHGAYGPAIVHRRSSGACRSTRRPAPTTAALYWLHESVTSPCPLMADRALLNSPRTSSKARCHAIHGNLAALSWQRRTDEVDHGRGGRVVVRR